MKNEKMAPTKDVADTREKATAKIMEAAVSVEYQPEAVAADYRDEQRTATIQGADLEFWRTVWAIRRAYVSMGRTRRNGKQIETNADAIIKLVEDVSSAIKL